MRQVSGIRAFREWETKQRAIRGRSVWAAAIGLLSLGLVCGLAGCSPPPPTTADADLAVEMPNDAAAGSVSTPLAPPQLTDVETGGATPEADTAGSTSPEKAAQETSDRESTSPDDASVSEAANSVASASNQAAGSSAKITSDESGEPFTDPRMGPDAWRQWPDPVAMLVVTGQQHGYIEPCGCTGLDRQKGGIARRFTFIKELQDKGWPLMAIDAGNQVRRFGRQAEVKLQQTVRALKMMDYQVVGFGPEDLRLGVGELLAVAAGESADDTIFASANVVLIDRSLLPETKVVNVGGLNIGVTSILDPDSLDTKPSDDITVGDKAEAAARALTSFRQDRLAFRVLMFYGKEEDARKLVQEVPGYDLLVVAGGYGEPTYQPELIEGTNTRMIVTGDKGMYAGLVGLYDRGELRYARVPLTHEFEDAPEMRQIMKEYQDQLRDIGLEGLGLLPPIPHSSGQSFVGSEKCGECHTTAFDIWEGTPHALATDHIVEPLEERGDVPRHFDPECLSCHVTGWNPQEYYPYLSGYLELEASAHLHGSGCENCHGPGSDHVAAEAVGSDVSEARRDQLRAAMVLPLDKAKEQCMTCHDLDNSPDFHEEDAFEDIYWPEVEHYGMD
jgi:hypothetical protein